MTTITNITPFAWFPQCNLNRYPAINCANGKVFLSDAGGSGGVFVTDPSGYSHYGMVAVSALTGVLDGINWEIAKNAFEGDVHVSSVLYNNGYYYVGGSWTHVLCNGNQPGLTIQQELYSAPRPSLMVRDSANGYAFKGDNIAFNGPTIIHYIPPSAFYQNEPDTISAMVFDGNQLHLFGLMTWVDGQPGNTHYIMNADGTRLQARFLYLK